MVSGLVNLAFLKKVRIAVKMVRQYLFQLRTFPHPMSERESNALAFISYDCQVWLDRVSNLHHHLEHVGIPSNVGSINPNELSYTML